MIFLKHIKAYDIYTVSLKKLCHIYFYCKTNSSVNVNHYNNAVLLSDAKFKQNMTKKVTKSLQSQDNQ